MPRGVTRIAVYAYPPDPLRTLMQRVWRGQFDHVLACELASRHAGECPIWDLHITLLDAIAIFEDDREEFVETMRRVLAEHLPITLSRPEIKEWGWGDNVFLRWSDDHELGRLRALRTRISSAAHRFAVIEKLDWERVNELDRLVALLPAPERFRDGLGLLKAFMQTGRPDLLYAPNVSLEWYVEALANGAVLTSEQLPFPLDPHISIATAVRRDERYGWPARQVGDYIKKNLKNIPEMAELVGDGVRQTIDAAYVVEPVSPANAIEITVIDRITRAPRREYRQPWVPTLALP